MLKRYVSGALGALMLLFSCTEAEMPETVSADVEISAGILARGVTRAQVSADGKGEFAEGDRISLLVYPGNGGGNTSHELTLTGGRWNPVLSWADFNASEAGFTAYYPVVHPDRSGRFVHEVLVDQRNRDGFERSDLLQARTTASEGEKVQLDFRHLMSSISVTLKSNVYTAEQLSKAEVSVYAFRQIEVDAADGALGRLKGNVEFPIRFRHTGGTNYQAVVCPQEVLDEWRERIWMNISVAGKSYGYLAPAKLADGTPFSRYEPGKQVALTVSLDKEADLKGQTVWVQGITNPDVSDWDLAFVNPNIPGLTWKPEYGWYDCNKLDPVTGAEDDNKMCWAAAATNMIYWWMDRNRDYISRWGGYAGPGPYVNAQDCPVFELFKRHFENEGGFPVQGLNWFFTGRFQTGTRPGAGFFKEVFGNSSLARDVVLAGSSLTKELKKAFRLGEAIELTLDLKVGSHAITVWGADFDMNGDVSAVYIVENNDRDVDEQKRLWYPEFGKWLVPAGLYRKEVKDVRGVPGKPDGAYMSNSSNGEFTVSITQLTMLNTMRGAWEEYFRKKETP